MPPNPAQPTMGPSSSRLFIGRGERAAQRDSPLVDVDVHRSHRQLPLTGFRAVAWSDASPRRESVDRADDPSGEATASASALCRVE